MTKFKGTKGKWEIKRSESKNAFNIVGTVIGGNYKIARIPYLFMPNFSEISNKNTKEAEANAKLIAAAPEMLEMLIRISEGKELLLGREIKQLIKKATE